MVGQWRLCRRVAVEQGSGELSFGARESLEKAVALRAKPTAL